MSSTSILAAAASILSHHDRRLKAQTLQVISVLQLHGSSYAADVSGPQLEAAEAGDHC